MVTRGIEVHLGDKPSVSFVMSERDVIIPAELRRVHRMIDVAYRTHLQSLRKRQLEKDRTVPVVAAQKSKE